MPVLFLDLNAPGHKRNAAIQELTRHEHLHYGGVGRLVGFPANDEIGSEILLLSAGLNSNLLAAPGLDRDWLIDKFFNQLARRVIIIDAKHLDCLFWVGIMKTGGAGETIGISGAAIDLIETSINGDIHGAAGGQFGRREWIREKNIKRDY